VDVSIIIVNYKTRGLVKQNLKSIRLAAPKLDYEVFVVDNASGDGIVPMIRESFPEARLMALPENVGFARGNNAAMKEAKGRYVFILNPDAMLTPGAVERMVEYMEAHPEAGMLAPKLVHPDRSVQDSVHRFPTPWIPVYRRTPLGSLPHARRELDRYLMRGELGEDIRDIDWAEGAALFVRRKAIDEVGMFDERFFIYFEDTDWARRFWQKDWKVRYFPDAEIIHYHRRESADASGLMALANKVTRLHIQSAFKYFAKWKDQPPPRE
jgi:N-acetylglucosaminyl-diphospho-decaprenol L-rhamnosyltransferase